MEDFLIKARKVVSRVTAEVFGKKFKYRIEADNNGTYFLQVIYDDVCRIDGEVREWHGRKWRLSGYMIEDELIKTAYVAFESAVKHEVMEGFKVDNLVLFNPHVNFEELLKISNKEVRRNEI